MAKKVGRPAGRGGPKNVQIAIRLPEKLLKRLDRYTRELQEETPWTSVTRHTQKGSLPAESWQESSALLLLMVVVVGSLSA